MATKYTFYFSDTSKTEFSLYPYTADGPVSPSDNTLMSAAASAQHTTLKLYGKGMQDYGEGIGQNMIYMLEHFANSSAPVNPLEGQAWYNNVGITGSPVVGPTGSQLSIYNGSTWDAIILATGTSHMTGELILAGDPTNDLGAATKLYVDTLVGAALHLTPDQNTFLDALNLPTLTAAEVNTLIGITTGSPEGSITVQSQLDDKLNLAGGTMDSGANVTIDGGNLYLINGTGSPIAGSVILSGGEVLGLPATPSATGAASKEYVDAQVASGGADGVLTNVTDVSGGGSPLPNPSYNTLRFTVTNGSPSVIDIGGISRVGHDHVSSEILFDNSGSPQLAPGLTTSVANVEDAIIELDSYKAPKASPTFTGTTNIGTLSVSGSGTFGGTVSALDPTISTHLATRNYVDNAIAGGVSIPVLTVTRTLETLGSPITTPTPYPVQRHGVDDNKLSITINGMKQYTHSRAIQRVLFDNTLILSNTGLDSTSIYDFAVNIDGGSPISVVTIDPTASPTIPISTYAELVTAINNAMPTSGSPEAITAIVTNNIGNGYLTFTTRSSGGSSTISISDPGTANTYLFATDPSPDTIIGANFYSNAVGGSPIGSPVPVPDEIIISGDVTSEYPVGKSFTIRGSNDATYGSYDGIYRVHSTGATYSGSPDQTLVPIALVEDYTLNTPLFGFYIPGASPEQTVPMTGSPAQYGTAYLTPLAGFDQIEAATAGVNGDYEETDSAGLALYPGDNSDYVVFDVTIPSGSTIETLLYS